jgi:hypothetical protein
MTLCNECSYIKHSCMWKVPTQDRRVVLELRRPTRSSILGLQAAETNNSPARPSVRPSVLTVQVQCDSEGGFSCTAACVTRKMLMPVLRFRSPIRGQNVKSSSYRYFSSRISIVNPLTPNDHYSCRTASLTSKRCILYIYWKNICSEYFKHGIFSPLFSSKCI